MPLSHSHWLVAVSLALAVLASYASLGLVQRVAAARSRLARVWLSTGAIAMGTGIWSMHFVGMLALSVPVTLRYDTGLTLASLAIAIMTSWYALKASSQPSLGIGNHVAASLVMGSGIAAMHYVGMSAIRLRPPIEYDPWLVAASVLVAVTASFVALGLAFRLRAGAPAHPRSVRAGAALLMGLAIAGMHFTGMAACRFHPDAHSAAQVSLAHEWLAVVVAVVTLGLLGVTLLAQVFDAYLAQRAAWHAQRYRAVQQRLQHQITHDPLTDLPNRASFMELLQRALDDCTTRPGLVAIFLIDIDRFKTVNESLGHIIGDSVLTEVAARLQRLLAPTGAVGRLGGDGFLGYARVEAPRDVARMASAVVHQLGRPYFAGKSELHLAASVGVTTYPLDNAGAEVLVSHADEAMYGAKRSGGNGYEIFVPGTTFHTLDRLALENDLWHAAQEGKLELHYQPQVDARTGRIVGLEALSRWHHETRGWIPPGEFIALAETSDIILEIGRWTLDEACRQMAAWSRAGHGGLSIAVNLSARQFREPDLVSIILGAIGRHGIEPRNLEIEVTESVAMADMERATGTLKELSEAGLKVAVDDFGTGHSSLAYLKRLPLSFLKIDQSFVRDLGDGSRSDAIVRAIVTLAQGLGLGTIAEGVETPAQLAALRELGCDRYQGFLFSRARSATDINRLLDAPVQSFGDAQVVEAILESVG